MSQKSEVVNSCLEDYLSGEESDSSYVTAFEDLDDLFPDLISDVSGNLTPETSFSALAVASCSSCGNCRIDVETQTSNCRFCRIILTKGERKICKTSSEETTSYDGDTCRVTLTKGEREVFKTSTGSEGTTSYDEDICRLALSKGERETGKTSSEETTSNDGDTSRAVLSKGEREVSNTSSEGTTSYTSTSASSISSPTTVTPPIRESDIESDVLSSPILDHFVQPAITSSESDTYAEYLVSETVVKEDNTMPSSKRSSAKSAEGTGRFANRGINSVARIIVADTIDAARMDKQSETKEIYHDTLSKADEVMWRQSPVDNSKETDQESVSAETSRQSLVEEEWHSSPVAESPSKPSNNTTTTITRSDIWRRPSDTNDPTLVEHAIWTVENLHEMWSQGIFCDVLLATSSGKEYSAHKVILGLHSGFFREIISGSAANIDAKGYWKITLSDSIRDKTLENILRFMYTSLVQINSDTISDLLHASVQLSIHRLIRLCMNYIDYVTIDNCFMVLAIAEKNNLSAHLIRTEHFIHDNFITVSKTESFLNTPIERVTRILTEDSLNVDSEVDVFLAAKRWSQRNQDAEMKSAAAVMKTIRFEFFSPEELAKHVESVEWLMEVPEVRVQVLEAYRYLSLAASEEKQLRPPAPTCRTSMSKASVGSKKVHRSGHARSKRDVSTAMSRTGGIDEAHHSRPIYVDPMSKHDISTSVSSKLFSTNLGKEQARRSQDSSNFSKEQHGRMSQERERSVLMLSGPEKKSKKLRKKRSDSRSRETLKTMKESFSPEAFTDSPHLREATKTTKDSFSPEAFMDSPHLRDQMMSNKPQTALEHSTASKTTIKSMSGNIPSKASKTSTKKSAENLNLRGLNKPGSDYRITTANPNSLIRGPSAWPQPKNIIPSGAEDDLSDLIVVSGGVSTKGDVDHPGKVLEVYDPQRGQWRESIEAPVARNHHVVIFLQDSLYLIGGSDPHSEGSDFIKPVKSVYRYDLRLSKWFEAASMSCARIFHQASTLLGQLYVVGGQNHEGRILHSVETYAPVSDTWRNVNPISTPRYAVAMTTYGQRLWVAGGYCEEAGSEMVDTVECFNPYSEEWTSIKSLRSARCHANLFVARGHLYLVGGYVIGFHGVDKHSTIDVYDDTEKRWRHVTDMEHDRHDGKTVAWHDKIYIFGARSDDDQERPLARVDYFDTTNNSWRRQAADLSSARFGHACCIVPARSATNWL